MCTFAEFPQNVRQKVKKFLRSFFCKYPDDKLSTSAVTAEFYRSILSNTKCEIGVSSNRSNKSTIIYSIQIS